ncbi:MAG: ATP synthase subunit I [Rubrivivax sp.]|nr:ATP synthase subunit I [Rubrivivax sp.]
MAIERTYRNDRWDDEKEGAEEPGGEPAFKPLTREEAQALRAKVRPISPWRVVGMQAGVGAGLALLAALIFGKQEISWSVLYGAATVVLPGALMARGITGRLSSVSPGASVVSFMLWEFVKIGVSVAMLILAPKLVQPLSWPALLVGLVVCLKVYWVALWWRGRVKESKA